MFRGVIDFFDKIEIITPEEAQELILNTYEHYISQFGPEIFSSEEYSKALDYSRELYYSILSRYSFSIENNLIHNKHSHSYEMLLCKKNKKNQLSHRHPN